MKETKIICHQQTCPKRMAKGSFLNRKDMIFKKGILDCRKEYNMVSKNMGK